MSTHDLDRVLQDAVASGAVPNLVVVVADESGVRYEGAAGPRAVGSDEPVTVDSKYWIMSLTTKVATVAALQLSERGALDLDAPVDDYCPAFGQLSVLDGFDGDEPRLRAPASKATVRQLITHTAGLGYWFFSDELVRYLEARPGADDRSTDPLLADPGTAFTYGLSSDWLTQVVEGASGRTLDVVVKEGIFGPLGMDRTSYTLDQEHRADQVPVHLRGEDGGWTASDVIVQMEPAYFAGGHGLSSTPRDYLQFQRALLCDGEVQGARILQPASVAQAFDDQLGGLQLPAVIRSADRSVSHDVELGEGHRWGLGLLLNVADVPGGRRAGTGSWAGLLNTQFWVDRSAGVACGIYTQSLPYAPPEWTRVTKAVEQAVYSAL